MTVFKKFFAVALVATTFVACKNDQSNPQTAPPAGQSAKDSTAVVIGSDSNETDPPAAAPNPEIVYVNSDSLLTNYQHFKDAKARLETKSKRLERDLRAKGEAFQKEVNEYQQSAGSLTPEQRAKTEERLGQKQQQLGTQQQTASTQLGNDENAEMKKIYEKVESYLKTLSQEKGYKMVLTYTRGSSAILYGDPSLDITNQVVSALNAEYKKAKAPAKK